jgi:phosphoadenosine phosphosulfate reductase
MVRRNLREPKSFDDLADRAAALDRALAGLDVTGRLKRFREQVQGTIAFATSFGLEDQVILHHMCEAGLDIDLVTLDTGRLFPETYATWQRSEQRYGRRVRAIYPRHAAVETLIASQGINGFYASREARGACCHVRKVEPLARALAGAQGWITGLRADQSAHRRGIAFVAADPERGLLKLAPLADWTRAAVQGFAAAHEVPTNPLHQQGFVSIGCAPCTRAIRPDEPEPLVVGGRQPQGMRPAQRAAGGGRPLKHDSPSSLRVSYRPRGPIFVTHHGSTHEAITVLAPSIRLGRMLRCAPQLRVTSAARRNPRVDRSRQNQHGTCLGRNPHAAREIFRPLPS